MIKITFNPEFPKGVRWNPSEIIDHAEIFWRTTDSNLPLIDIVISFDDKDFRYYPANMGTVLSDILREHKLSSESSDHALELSGYPLADLSFDGETVIISPISEFEKNQQIKTNKNDYISALEEGIGSLLDEIDRTGVWIRNKRTNIA